LAVNKRKKMGGFLIDRSETVGISCLKGVSFIARSPDDSEVNNAPG
jgi:hypothetical protein